MNSLFVCFSRKRRSEERFPAENSGFGILIKMQRKARSYLAGDISHLLAWRGARPDGRMLTSQPKLQYLASITYHICLPAVVLYFLGAQSSAIKRNCTEAGTAALNSGAEF